MSVLHGEQRVSLSIGSIDSGSAKSFDFFGASAIVDEIATLLIDIWDRIKYCAEDTFRYQIELAMVSSGFVLRAKKMQAEDEQLERTAKAVAKCIEMLFRSGAYTGEMDAPREMRASRILAAKEGTVKFKEEGTPIEVNRDNARPALETRTWQTGTSIAGLVPAVAVMLPKGPA